MRILDNFRKWVYNMTNKNQKSINIYEVNNKVLPNEELKKYKNLYENKAEWIKGDVRSLNLCKSTMQEITKAALSEYKLKCENEEIQDICDELSKLKFNFLTKLGVYGNVLIRPYISGNKYGFSLFDANSFNVDFDAYGNLIEAVIYNKAKKKNKENNMYIYYTLVETHTYYENYINDNSAHVIHYELFKSDTENELGNRIPLDEISDYENLTEEIIIEGVDRNLCIFAPLDNTEYFIGKSYFENAYSLFEDADKQYSSVLWEYEGGELAIDADEALFRKEENKLTSKVRYELPKGKERLYRKVSQANITGDNKLPMTTFAPTLRDTSYWQGLNNIKRNIELTLGLSYGVISEPTSIAMTATEIVSSKQRFYTTIKNFQNILISAFSESVQSMITMLNALDKDITNDYDLEFHFDDGILTTTKEKVDELAILLSNGIITVEEARQNYFEKL